MASGSFQTGSQSSARTNGIFEDGVWKCDCNPPQPAAHYQVRKQGPNTGRFFRTCKTRSCPFFLFDKVAIVREGGELAIDRSRRTPSPPFASSLSLQQPGGDTRQLNDIVPSSSLLHSRASSFDNSQTQTQTQTQHSRNRTQSNTTAVTSPSRQSSFSTHQIAAVGRGGASTSGQAQIVPGAQGAQSGAQSSSTPRPPPLSPPQQSDILHNFDMNFMPKIKELEELEAIIKSQNKKIERYTRLIEEGGG